MQFSRYLAATALAGSAAMLPGYAIAQDNEGDTTGTATGNEIIVTGSRISSPNFDTPVPVAGVSAQQIEAVGQVSLGDTLNRLPALRASYSQANSTAAIGTAGVNALDLRGLGVSRTLVLVNGRRHVSGIPGTYSVDVNTIPNALLERVDVVTGANSAVYGADAVSGVVNFVLKENYEGLDFRARSGISDRQDRGSVLVSGLWGKNFNEGRGNITISGEYARSKRLMFSDRNSQTGAYTGVPGFYQTEQTTFLNPDGTARNEPPEGNGIPDTTYFPGFPGSFFSNLSLGGAVVTTCPGLTATNQNRVNAVCTGEVGPTGGRLSDYYMFATDGSLLRNNPEIDLRSIGGGVFGGLGATGVEGAMLLPGYERMNFNVMTRYEVSPAFVPYLEAKFVRTIASQTSTQPSFVNGTLSPVFRLDNPFLTDQARDTIRLISGFEPGTAEYDNGTFNFFRFNNDIGTRAEQHERNTYRVVAGARGEIAQTGNWQYDVFFNYGRTETYYETGGNINVLNFNRATDAVRNSAGDIVCRTNLDANSPNYDPNCRPINLFGEGAPATTPDAVDYVLYTSSRKQWAEQYNAVAAVTGNTAGFLNLPGGPIGLAFGTEYRREDYYSAYDEFTRGEYSPGQSNTFLNAIDISDPDPVSVIEAFAEVRVPIFSNRPFFHDLTLNASGRASKYNIYNRAQVTWSAGGTWAPVPDIAFRANWGLSIRTPNLQNLYAGTAQTFANAFVDPCSQTVIGQNPNRARNCAADGIPTTIDLGFNEDGSPDIRPWTNTATSGILGVNGGNPFLRPERSYSFTVGTIIKPRALPGVQLSIDYYNIRINDAINSLSPQTIINSCYDDPTGIDNEFCGFINRRRTPDNLLSDYTLAGQQARSFAGLPDIELGVVGNGFVNAPFNYAKLSTSGIDGNLRYGHRFNDESRLSVSTVVSWLASRRSYSVLNDPDYYTRLNGVIGDPEWRALATVFYETKKFDVSLTGQYTGRQTIGAWNLQNTEQDRPPTNADRYPVIYYPQIFTADIQIGVKVNENFRLYTGVDNVTDRLPPYGATGTSDSTGIFDVIGRYYYWGVRVKT